MKKQANHSRGPPSSLSVVSRQGSHLHIVAVLGDDARQLSEESGALDALNVEPHGALAPSWGGPAVHRSVGEPRGRHLEVVWQQVCVLLQELCQLVPRGLGLGKFGPLLLRIARASVHVSNLGVLSENPTCVKLGAGFSRATKHGAGTVGTGEVVQVG